MATINSIGSNKPIQLSFGGTNASSMSTSTGIVKYDGTSLVTSSTAKIDASDRYTNTSQPAFYAYADANLTGVTGDSTAYQVVFGSTRFDQNSNYNTGTGLFTAPISGRYLFGYSLYANGLLAANTIGYIRLFTTNDHFYLWSQNPFAAAGSGTIVFTGSVFANMTAGDTAYLSFRIDGNATKNVNLYGRSGSGLEPGTYFWGYLVC